MFAHKPISVINSLSVADRELKYPSAIIKVAI